MFEIYIITDVYLIFQILLFEFTKPSYDKWEVFGIIWWQQISDKSVKMQWKKILKPTGIVYLYFIAYKTIF